MEKIIIKNTRSFYFLCVFSLSLFAIVIHILTIHHYSSGMPYMDDYDAILGFLNTFLQSDFRQNIPHLFHQSNEHRILLDNLISISMVMFTGHFNFIWMIWIGNLGWFLLVFLFWKFSEKNQITFIEFSPVLIVMMCLSHFELMTMAMGSVQHYFQIFFCVLSIWFLVSNRLLFALAFFICAIFTSGGGICLIPVILIYHILRKEWRNLLICIVTFGIVLYIYFPLLGYTQPATHPNVFLALKSPIYLITYAFSFLGNIGNLYKSSIGLGIIFTIYLISKWRFLSTNYPFLFWLITFLLIVSITNAITRGGFGIKTGQVSRYTIYSLIYISIFYFTLLLSSTTEKKRKYLSNIAFFISLGIFAYWYQHGQKQIASRYADLESGVLQYPSLEYAKSSLKDAAKLGYYYPTKTPHPPFE